jgi:tryptophanyl-tRNA synthetase
MYSSWSRTAVTLTEMASCPIPKTTWIPCLTDQDKHLFLDEARFEQSFIKV